MKIALVGYGRMGRALETMAMERGHQVVARIDLAENPPGLGLSSRALAGAEVAMEFTTPEAAARNLKELVGCGVDVVCGTTGWLDSVEDVTRAVEKAGTGLVHAPNFSLGVQMLFKLAALTGRLADRLDEYDPHVLEIHHRHKVDHPSGTARRIADIVLEEVARKERWELGPGRGAVCPSVLQVNAVRAGENPGEHVLALEGPDDRIEVRHQAKGRAGFARGAVAGAEWVRGRKGVFTLDDMVAELWS
jgi:4-hydroxy-tetrahydrodipicolinate reductase